MDFNFSQDSKEFQYIYRIKSDLSYTLIASSYNNIMLSIGVNPI